MSKFLIFRAHAQEIRRQAASELKHNEGASKALNHRIGRSSVASIASLSGISSSALMGPPPPPPSSSGQFLTAPPATSAASSSGPGSLNESVLVEPLDYEEYVSQQQRLVRGQQKSSQAATSAVMMENNTLVDFPPDDIEVNVVPRKIRTMGHVLPEEPM